MNKRQKKKLYRKRLEECNYSYIAYLRKYVLPLKEREETRKRELAELERLKEKYEKKV